MPETERRPRSGLKIFPGAGGEGDDILSELVFNWRHRLRFNGKNLQDGMRKASTPARTYHLGILTTLFVVAFPGSLSAANYTNCTLPDMLIDQRPDPAGT